MASLAEESEMSLEEDTFEVECWRYVGEPVGFGSAVASQTLRAGVAGLGKGSGPVQNEKNDGWFGVSSITSSLQLSHIGSSSTDGYLYLLK